MKQLFNFDDKVTRAAVSRDGRLWVIAAVRDEPFHESFDLASRAAQVQLVRLEFAVGTLPA